MNRLRGLCTMLALALVAAVAMGASGVRGGEPATPTPLAAHDHHTHHGETPRVTVPTAAEDGVLEIVIPRGLDAAMEASGDAAYYMPSVIRVQVGDTMTIRNDDVAPHMILFAFLLPGEQISRVFDHSGSETYTSGCAAHAASFHDFTTIFITEH